jgi:putative aldouronate transport system substrate-binding protein
MLRAFKEKDPNGNGKADEIPFSGRQNFAFSEAFFAAYDVIPGGWKYENNQLVPNFIRPQMKQALELHRKLYQEQLMDNEIFVQQGKDWDAKIKGAARVGMWVHDPGYPDKWQSDVKQNEPKAELVNIPAPTGPDGKGGMLIGSPVNMAWTIPKSNKNPEAAIKFLDWFYSDEAQKFNVYGLEGEDYKEENGKVNYKYPTTADEINKENMHVMFLSMAGPSYLANDSFMKGRKDGDLIANAIQLSKSEGRKDDGLGMSLPPTLQSKPELGKNGLWMETAAKIMTGKDPIDSFDKFVEDWKKRGGDQIIKEATEWYNAQNKK